MNDSSQRIFSHAGAIEHLRKDATELMVQVMAIRAMLEGMGNLNEDEKTETTSMAFSATCMMAVADLLECHDETGINITKFGFVKTFVNSVMVLHGLGEVHDNYV